MSTSEESKPSSIECNIDTVETVNDITIEHAYSEDRDSSSRHHGINSTSSDSLFIDETIDDIQEDICGSPEQSENSAPKMEVVPEKVKSRELKSLLDAAKESNLDTNIVHKRESRRNVDLYSNRSSDGETGRRTMRSQNPDFAAKHQKFLSTVQKLENNSENVAQDETSRNKDNYITNAKSAKKRKDNTADSTADGSSSEDKKSRKSMKLDAIAENMRKKGKDNFCWRCHREGVLVACGTCPRSYHHRCLKQPVADTEHWPCPECLSILQADSTRTRSRAMREISLEHLCELLKFAVKRMMSISGVEPFLHPVDTKSFPDYGNYVVHPMDLTTMESNIRNGNYGSTVAFTADAKWLLHNSIIFNSSQSKLTQMAKSLIKICKQEMYEIETCAECYLNANTKPNSWFVEVCTRPHILLWAKLKGFPYWPAKAMIVNNSAHVDVRFFGAHDRAWIPLKDCYLYCRKDPNTTNKVKRNNIAECIKEVTVYIRNMCDKYGDFYFAPYRTPYNPAAEWEQLTYMLPGYKSVENDNMPRGRTAAQGNARPSTSEDETKGKSKSRASSEVREQRATKRSQSRATSEVRDGSEEIDQLSILLNYPHKELDKFVEGAEIEEELASTDGESQKKLIPIQCDSDDDEYDNKSLLTLRNEELKNGKSVKRYSNKRSASQLVAPSKVRTRGGYQNVIGKMKVMANRTYSNIQKRNSSSPMHGDLPRKQKRSNSEVSSKSDSSRVSGLSDKVNRVDELSDTIDVKLTNKNVDSPSEDSMTEKKLRPEFVCTFDKPDMLKPKSGIQINAGDLFKNKEFRISPQGKSVSMADQLMKKITGQDAVNTETNTNKRKSSSPEPKPSKLIKAQSLENVSTSNCNKKPLTTKENVTQYEEHSYSTPAVKENDKNQSVTSSSESIQETVNNIENVNTKKLEIKNPDSNRVVLKRSRSKTPSKTTFVIVKRSADDVLNNCKEISLQNKTCILNENVQSPAPEGISNTITPPPKNSNQTEEKTNVENSVEESSTTNEEQNLHVKIVNVSDIISGKVCNSVPQNKDSESTPIDDIVDESIEIKSEPDNSDNEDETVAKEDGNKDSVKPLYDVTLTLVDKKKENVNSSAENSNANPNTNTITSTTIGAATTITTTTATEKEPFKVVDNITKVINSVAKGNEETDRATNTSLSLNTNEITLRPIKLVQKARKTFPNSPHKMQQIPFQLKRLASDSRDSLIRPSFTSMSKPPTLHSIQPTSGPAASKDLFFLNAPSVSVPSNISILPPSQAVNLNQSVNNSVFTMVQHSNLAPPSIIIQQSSASSVPKQPVPSTSHSAMNDGASTSQTGLFDNSSAAGDNMAKAIGELLSRPLPQLKPRPPAPLTNDFEELIPSSAGPVTALINSVSHKFTDYFRGLLKETLKDLADMDCPEAKIRSLELQLETLKHRHQEELVEMRKNVNATLKDVQKSIIEEKSKAIEETRALCEAERIRCVEEAKSKQWCAYCFKEAQFYCCWNTSYCDYPCQQNHWQTHMKICSHSSVRSSPSSQNSREKSPAHTANSQPSTQPTNQMQKLPPKHTYTNNKSIMKPAARMFMKPPCKPLPMYVPLQRPAQSSSQTLTFVEAGTGSYEFVGNNAFTSKIVTTAALKVKPGSVMTMAQSSASSSTNTTGTNSQKTILLTQKPPAITKQPSLPKENSSDKS